MSPRRRFDGVDQLGHAEAVLGIPGIVPGGADRSYGIHVAKLAGLPTSVIDRAQEVLAQLEQTDSTTATSASSSKQDQESRSLPQPHPILDEVRQIDLFSMTPLDALNRLADLQRRAANSDNS